MLQILHWNLQKEFDKKVAVPHHRFSKNLGPAFEQFTQKNTCNACYDPGLVLTMNTQRSMHWNTYHRKQWDMTHKKCVCSEKISMFYSE